jgi:hypothetical protein
MKLVNSANANQGFLEILIDFIQIILMIDYVNNVQMVSIQISKVLFVLIVIPLCKNKMEYVLV